MQLASALREAAAGEWQVQHSKPCHKSEPAFSTLVAPHLSARPVHPVPVFLGPHSPPKQVQGLQHTPCWIQIKN